MAPIDTRGKIYHYTSYNALICILKENSFKLSVFKESNDRREWISRKFADGDSLDNYKYIAACAGIDGLTINNRGYANPSLWYHYANRHKGVCIEFDLETLASKQPSPIKRGRITYNGHGVNRQLSMCIEDFFMEKSEEWKGEMEYRLIYNGGNDKIMGIAECITGVYLGCGFTLGEKTGLSRDILNFTSQRECDNINIYTMISCPETGRLQAIHFPYWVHGVGSDERAVISEHTTVKEADQK